MQYLNLSDRSDTLIICGDIHGEFRTLVYTIEQKLISDAVIIVAGDCGFGFEKLSYYDLLYKRLHKKLKKLNVLLLMVRGNHDDPLYFSKEVIDFPFMKTLPDYTIVHTSSHNILCIGGAVSIDRNFRLSKMAYDQIRGKKHLPIYWPEEFMIYDEKELNILEQEQITIDTVVTHTAPSFCPPFSKGDLVHWCEADEYLADDIRQERNNMDKLYNHLIKHNHPLNAWYYAHYHTSASHIQDNTHFHLLDIMELQLIF